MAEEEPQQLSIQARIKALNVGQVGRAPITATPSKPPLNHRPNSVNVPVTSSQNNGIGNEPRGPGRGSVLPPPVITRTGQATDSRPTPPPRLPPRKSSTQLSPILPPRRTSDQLRRKESMESISSVLSTQSSVSTFANGMTRTSGSRAPSIDGGPPRIMAPAFDAAKLPPLPPKRAPPPEKEKYIGRPSLTGSRSTGSVLKNLVSPKKTPTLPQRPAVREPSRETGRKLADPPAIPARSLPPPTANGTKAMLNNFSNTREIAPSPAVANGAKAMLNSYSKNQGTELPPPVITNGTKSMLNSYVKQQGTVPPPVVTGEAKAILNNYSNGGKSTETPLPAVANGAKALAKGLSNGRASESAPPPIPLSSRPDLSKIMGTKPKTSGASAPASTSAPTSSTNSCLKCRDFSGPDNHAANYPRQNVPSLDWLANELTSPFPSLTDKARAIFTWLHHNIDYDVVAFFGNNVRGSTPTSTLATGLAVCEGYASLFTALATKAGMESIIIGGHGKGYGFSPIPPGGSPPPEEAGHAWNGVKLEDGNWKLIDPCWGSGNIKGAGEPYNRDFSPNHFTKDNDEFGLSHFPTNRAHQFRLDGRTMSWTEYVLGDQGGPPVRVYSNIAPREGLNENTFIPRSIHLPISPSAHAGPTVRFQFEKVCSHWDPLAHAGKPFVYILAVGKGGEGKGDFIPFDTNTDSGGMFWWVDVPPAKLGVKGETLSVFTVDTVDGMSGRGLTKEEYLMAKGRKAMGFSGVAAWELV